MEIANGLKSHEPMTRTRCPPIDQSLLPADVRGASADDRKRYARRARLRAHALQRAHEDDGARRPSPRTPTDEKRADRRARRCTWTCCPTGSPTRVSANGGLGLARASTTSMQASGQVIAAPEQRSVQTRSSPAPCSRTSTRRSLPPPPARLDPRAGPGDPRARRRGQSSRRLVRRQDRDVAARVARGAAHRTARARGPRARRARPSVTLDAMTTPHACRRRRTPRASARRAARPARGDRARARHQPRAHAPGALVPRPPRRA